MIQFNQELNQLCCNIDKVHILIESQNDLIKISDIHLEKIADQIHDLNLVANIFRQQHELNISQLPKAVAKKLYAKLDTLNEDTMFIAKIIAHKRCFFFNLEFKNASS